MQRTEKKEHTTFCVDLTQSTPLPSKRHFSRVPGLIANHLSTWTAMAIWTNLPLRDSPISKPFIIHVVAEPPYTWRRRFVVRFSFNIVDKVISTSHSAFSSHLVLWDLRFCASPGCNGGADPLRRRRQWIETAAYCTRLTLSKFYPLLLGRVKLIKPNFNSDPETNRTKRRVSDLCLIVIPFGAFSSFSLSPSLSLSANHGW